MKQIATLSCSALLLWLGACSSNSGSTPVPDTCGPACRSVAVCYASAAGGKPRVLDQPGCEKQCALELAGKGVLSLDVAKKVFGQMASVAPRGDVDCKLGGGFNQFTATGDYLANVSDPEYLKRCAATKQKLCPDIEPTSQLGECFSDQYTYNDTIRGALENCAKVSGACFDFRRCYNETLGRVRPVCEPWFGPSGADCQ